MTRGPNRFQFTELSTLVLKDSCKLLMCGQNVDYEENVKSNTTLLLFIFNSLLFKDVYWKSFMLLFILGLIFLQTTDSLIIFSILRDSNSVLCKIKFKSSKDGSIKQVISLKLNVCIWFHILKSIESLLWVIIYLQGYN